MTVGARPVRVVPPNNRTINRAIHRCLINYARRRWHIDRSAIHRRSHHNRSAIHRSTVSPPRIRSDISRDSHQQSTRKSDGSD